MERWGIKRMIDDFFEDYFEAMVKVCDENLKEWLQKQSYG